jgi:hypothetical protein
MHQVARTPEAGHLHQAGETTDFELLLSLD